MISYFFGGETGLTPEDIKRQRALAAALAESRTPQNVGEGVGALMKGIAGALIGARANAAEKAGRLSATQDLSPILAALSDARTTPDANVTTTTPDFSVNAATDAKSPVKMPSIKSPQDAVDLARANTQPANIAVAPIDGTMENARKTDRASDTGYSSDVRGFQKVLRAGKGWTEVVGPDGTTLRREGARNWRNNNPGNIEYGDFAKRLGAIGTDGRFAVFPTYEIGRKAKEALLFENPNYRDKSISAAITRYAPPVENNTNAYISSVANAIGVDPGTPLSALTPQQRTVMMDAMQKVEGFRPGREIPLDATAAFNAQPNLNKPVEIASLDGNVPIPATRPVTEQVPVVDVPEGFQQPDPLQTQQKPVEVADSSKLTATPKRAKNEPSDEVVIKALMNPWLDDSQKAVAQMYYQQRINEREFNRKLEAERNDPKYKMDLAKGQLELEKLRNPPKSRTLTDDEEKALGVDTSGVYQMAPDGAITTIQKPKERKTLTVNGRVIDAETGETITEVPQQIDPIAKDRLAFDREKFLKEFQAGDWEYKDGILFNKKTGDQKPLAEGMTPTVNFDDVSGLRKEIQQLPSYKNLAQALPIYKSMAETAGRNSKASDLNLVYGLGKIMDPTSVVREGEMIMVKNTASLPDWFQGVIASVNGNAALTPETRKAIMEEAYGRIKGYDGQFKQDANMYQGIVERNKFNPADVIPDFGEYAPWEPAPIDGAIPKDGANATVKIDPNKTKKKIVIDGYTIEEVE